MKNSLKLLFTVILFTFAGCSQKDEPQPIQTKCLISKQINQGGGYTEYTYKGDLLIRTEYKSTSGIVFFRIEYEYSGTKETKYSQFDNQTGNNILTYQSINEYNGNNLVKRQTISYDRTTRKPIIQRTTIAEFDNDNNKIKDIITTQRTNPDATVTTSETMSMYEYQGKLLTKRTYFSKSRTTNEFVKANFNTYNYDANGNVIEEKRHDSSGKLYATTKNTYNSANKLLKVIQEQSGTSYISDLYEYDAKDNQSLQIAFDRDGNKYFEYKTVNEYNAKGNIIKQTTTYNDYNDPNSGDLLTTPFTSETTVYINEYSCPK